MHDIIISAPFGNYLNYPNATSTLGTFTLRHRGGTIKRLWRMARTLRPLGRAGGWINKLGLPNPGIHSLPLRCYDIDPYADKIVSIHGFCADDWRHLAYTVSQHQPGFVEMNLSCPNVAHTHYLKDLEECVSILLRNKIGVIAKLPPVKWMAMAVPLRGMGVNSFHCCNTIPTPGGGISGKAVKNYSLWATEELKQKWGAAVRVIGGGGVTGVDDVTDYLKAGADHVAIGSAFLNPFRWRALGRICRQDWPFEKLRGFDAGYNFVEFPTLPDSVPGCYLTSQPQEGAEKNG